MPPPDGDLAWLIDIQHSARRIRRAVDGLTRAEYEADEYRVLSVERLFEMIGEATKQLSPGFRSAHPEIPWRRMAGMRDMLIHAYRDINPDEVWKAISISIPALLTALDPLVPPEENEK